MLCGHEHALLSGCLKHPQADQTWASGAGQVADWTIYRRGRAPLGVTLDELFAYRPRDGDGASMCCCVSGEFGSLACSCKPEAMSKMSKHQACAA